ncbi:inositol monophosphatase [Candidatus Daviesbacteria bacterium]|nr:inositol monophosphatase [Candidatus Daviesbacteria bacterium]
MSSLDLTQAKEYVVSLLPKAGEILKRHFESTTLENFAKVGVDFTTEADKEVDEFLLNSLKEKFPDHNFLTEESAPEDYSGLKSASNLWVIDPLDGTSNFSRKFPHFAISIGLVEKGQSQLAIAYLPLTQDLYWTDINQTQAFLNGKVLKVSETSDLKKAVIGCDWAWNLEKRKNVLRFLEKIALSVRQIKCMGSAVCDLCLLAEGKIDGYFHSGLKPWDTAASSLIIQKAGGIITTPKGEKWDVFNPDMLASNQNLYQKLLDLLNN